MPPPAPEMAPQPFFSAIVGGGEAGGPFARLGGSAMTFRCFIAGGGRVADRPKCTYEQMVRQEVFDSLAADDGTDWGRLGGQLWGGPIYVQGRLERKSGPGARSGGRAKENYRDWSLTRLSFGRTSVSREPTDSH